MYLTWKEITDFFNSQFISSILGSAVGASMTFYFVNKRDSKILQIKKDNLNGSLLLLIGELEENLERFNRIFVTAQSPDVLFDYNTKYWDTFQSDIKQFYPSLHADYTFFYHTMLIFISGYKTGKSPDTLNSLKLLSMGYRLSLYLSNPQKIHEPLSALFHPSRIHQS